MSVQVLERAGSLGFKVIVQNDDSQLKDEILAWLSEHGAVLDRSVFPPGYGRMIDAETFGLCYVVYVLEISDEKRMLFKLTF